MTHRLFLYAAMSALAAALGLLVCWLLGLPLLGIDDANILFVYSRHLADGAGLVYNVGGERVEGFSSMLWMLIAALGYLVSNTPFEFFLLAQAVLIGCALGFALEFIRDHLNPRLGVPASRGVLAWPGLVFLVWMIASPGYFMWNVTSLMDSGLWSSLVLLTTVRLLRLAEEGPAAQSATFSLALLFAAMVLSRPEAIAWGLAFTGLLLVILRNSGVRGPEFWRQLLVPAASFGLTLGALTLFRQLYFGFPLPNTYYAKMSPDTLYNLRYGIEYFLQFMRDNQLALLTLLVAVYCVFRYLAPTARCFFAGDKPQEPVALAAFVAGSTTVTGIVVPILMGGDIFGAFRFFQPIWPLLLLTALYALVPLLQSQPSLSRLLARPAGSCLAVLVIVAASLLGDALNWPLFREDKIWIRNQFYLARHGQSIGANIENLFAPLGEPLPAVGASAAGGLKLGYRGQVTDLMGLNFTPMAHHGGSIQGVRGHAAFSKAVFWQYPPDLVEPELCAPDIQYNRMLSPDFWQHRILRGLPLDEDFMSQYTYVVIDVPEQERSVCTYVRNTLLESMQASGQFGLRYPERAPTPEERSQRG